MMKKLSEKNLLIFSQLYSIIIFGSNIDPDFTTMESNGALSNNLLIKCLRKVSGFFSKLHFLGNTNQIF